LKEKALDRSLENSLWKKLWTSGWKDYSMNEWANMIKIRPRKDHEGPEGEQIYSCTLYLTWALIGGGWSIA